MWHPIETPEVPETPSLENLGMATQETVWETSETVVEWIPQSVAFCERNPQAMQNFFAHTV